MFISQDRAVIVVDQFAVIGNVLIIINGDAGRWLSLRTNKVLRGSKLVCRTLFSGGCSLIRGILPLRPPGRVRSPLLFAAYLLVRETMRLATKSKRQKSYIRLLPELPQILTFAIN